MHVVTPDRRIFRLICLCRNETLACSGREMYFLISIRVIPGTGPGPKISVCELWYLFVGRIFLQFVGSS